GVTDIALRELGLSAVPALAPVEVMRTLRQLADLPADADRVDAFESSYARLRAEARKTPTPETVWTFYCPLKVRLVESLTEQPVVTVLGTAFRFSRVAAVVRVLGARQLEPAALVTLLHAKSPIDVPPVFLVAAKKASDANAAW